MNNDFIFNGFKVDVKTITSKVCPELYFKASVAKTSNQQCDIIVFSRILPDMSLIRFVGWLTKSEFDKVKKLFEKGTEDKSNNLVAKADTWDCYIHQLSAMKYLEPHILTS